MNHALWLDPSSSTRLCLALLHSLWQIGLLAAFENEGHDFNAGALHVVEDPVHPGAQVSVGDHAGDAAGGTSIFRVAKWLNTHHRGNGPSSTTSVPTSTATSGAGE